MSERVEQGPQTYERASQREEGLKESYHQLHRKQDAI